MKTKKEIVVLVGNYYNTLVAKKDEFISARGKELSVNLNGKTGQDAHDALCSVVETIKAHVKGAAVESGVNIPAYRTNVRTQTASPDSDVVTTLEIDFRNKLNAEVVFARKFSFDVKSEDLIGQVYDSFITVMNELAYMELAQEVIDEVNAKLAEIKEEHPEITVSVSFVYCDASDDIVVSAISDDSIQFAAPLAGVLEATGSSLFQSGDNFADLCNKNAVDDYVERMSAVQFAPQVIKANVDIVNKMLGMKITRRADKVLRRTYHKKAQFLTKQKEGIGYFSETLEDGTVIFALIEKSEEKYSVILSPFDAKTLEKIKVDVLKKCGLKGNAKK